MAKKRFTEGMDSLFEETTPSPRPSKGRGSSSSGSPRRRSSGKDFSDDLSSLLQEAFEESFDEQVEQKEQADQESADKPDRPLTGLDALIRNTLEPAAVTIDPKAKRRLVVSFHEEQLAKLRAIARLKKTRLKQIIHTIVEGYIEQYEDEKGKLS